MEEYRKRAKAKYEAEKIEKERIQRDVELKQKEEEERQKQEIQRRLDEASMKKNKVMSIIWEIEENVDNLQMNYNSENILYNLTLIESLIHNNIEFLKTEDKLGELQTIVLNLIDILNMLNENKEDKKDLNVLKNISVLMKNIFELVDLDIKIELMDTSNDENFAKEFNKKLNNL